MYKDVPAQIWLLIALGAAAYAPAHYVFRYLTQSPSTRDITQPAIDFSWRTPGQFARNAAILAAVISIGVFIFTPQAAQLAKSPAFMPILLGVFGAWALSTVVGGMTSGKIEPLVRGFNNTYQRSTQPKRFWASLAWNTVLGFGYLWLGFMIIREAPKQALERRCYDWKNDHLPKVEIAACDQLIAKNNGGEADLAELLMARGAAYHRLGNYQQAVVDYDKAVLLNPHSSSLHYNRALALEHLDGFNAVAQEYGEAIRYDAANADAYRQRGSIYLETGELDMAIADFSKDHELRPKDPMPLALRGLCYAWKKDSKRAKIDFAAVRATDPSNVILLHGEAVLSINVGDLAAAIVFLTQALKLAPEDIWSLKMRAEAFRLLGRSEEAKADVGHAQRLSSENTVGKSTAH